ncbi:TPA: amidohydrolase [Enterobacter hormaechei subsp. hoffmannii]|uniref:Amidohydrolase n=2 Tax=Enterobacter hormaechei TaxID=158836 RepID=A0A3S0G1U4_9ENTR|nr:MULTISPECIES: amidohydrolase [Enterobacter]ASB75211.1 hydrolase [Enterobacter cloacae complex sp.]AVU20147.1 amidohydrolase [Enterobacter cloacae]EHF4957153.1 amidohydrolase [Enterobacter hormaechei]EHF4972226.1 amidohydrolase [Enterobacter hormaechei]EHF5013745.1 amidohydrolase [Enterobacter hormaechei]
MSFSEQLIAWRRELHQNPELSGQEVETTARLREWLTAAGIAPLPYDLQTGLVAEIGTGNALVALRADIDALPIDERSGVPFSSRRAGVMHACGHDIHTSVILGAALKLKEREASLNGRVRILFQPAEENFGGAKSMVRAGALRDVRAIFGMHNEPSLPVGEFATRGGPFYANVDRFVIHVTGKGAHAARPHEGNDAIVLASQLVTALQSVASRNVNTLDSVVLSVTRIAGGNTWNVLPESVELEGTLRTHRMEVQQNVKARVGEIAAGFASAFSAQINITWFAGPTALVNDEHWAGFATSVAREAGYETRHAELHMGGEDFAVYLQNIPGAFVSIGSNSPFGLHHPAFNPDEALIEPAARYFAQLAEKALQHV